MLRLAKLRTLSAILALAGGIGSAHAQMASTPTPATGFQLNRYEPTTVGEWSLLVDHPWYSSMRYFAVGITMNYGHAPLVFGQRSSSGAFMPQGAAIEHQLIGHVDLAGSFLDRIQISASLPVTLVERGAGGPGLTLVAPVAVGDPRVGLKIRLFGQPYRSGISMSLGADVWIPAHHLAGGPFPNHVVETGVRALPKLMIGGLASSFLWSINAGFYYRPFATIGGQPPALGNTVDSEIQIGVAMAYANYQKRFSIGPEALLSTNVGLSQPGTAFKQDYTSLEVLLGIHYNIAKVLQLSLGGGVGVLRQPGNPDGRALLRLAYAPIRDEKPKDSDGDTIPDKTDACPDEAGIRTTNPRTNGCPPPAPRDSDRDGVVDAQDLCPTVPQGATPDPARRGCPKINRDRDGDGVLDSEDRCIDEPAGATPDPNLAGCPLRDKDGDGVVDNQDRCPEVAAGANPDPDQPGCPDKDSDGDGVYDGRDRCREIPAGMNPDTSRPGCPLSDRDNDQIPDVNDACPDKPGAPSADPQKNGCPGLVEMRNGQIVILRQVFFAINKDVVLKESFPVLDAVAATLKLMPQIKKVAVEGHTDNQGKPEDNRSLSERRAQSVVNYLIIHGIAAERLEAHGYGPDQPIADNKTPRGRSLNRRTDFRIIDPPMTNSAPPPRPPVSAAPRPAPKAAPKVAPKAPVRGAAPAKGVVKGKATPGVGKPAAKPVAKPVAKPAVKKAPPAKKGK